MTLTRIVTSRPLDPALPNIVQTDEAHEQGHILADEQNRE
jgi:hypothetical protein